MDIAFDNKEISLKLKRHDAQNGHHVETIYIALVLFKDRMVQTNCRKFNYSTTFPACQLFMENKSPHREISLPVR